MALNFTSAALENINETGINPVDDVAALRNGAHTRASLLEFCLNGADPDREQGWHDYVATVATEAGLD